MTENKATETIKELCKTFKIRSEALSLGKGKRRDEAAMHFFVGAATATQDSLVKQAISFFSIFSLAPRGYKAIEEEL